MNFSVNQARKNNVLQLALALAFSGTAISHSVQAQAATCAAASSATNTISTSCEDLDWASGDLTISSSAAVTSSGGTSGSSGGIIPALDPSGQTLGSLTIDTGASIVNNYQPGGRAIYTDTYVANRSISSIVNNGMVRSYYSESISLQATSIGTITNNGSIQTSYSSGSGLRFTDYQGTVGTVINSSTGVISGSIGVRNVSTISILNNDGQITGVNTGIDNGGTITTLNNITGTITGGSASNLAAIYNSSNIVTLNNGQTGLTYRGYAPSAYNVYVTSPTGFGTLIIKDTTNFGIAGMAFGVATGSTVSRGATYQNVIQANNATFDSTTTKTGTYTAGGTTYSYSLVWDGAAWDLMFEGNLGPTVSAANTLQSVQMNAGGMAAVVNQQSAAYQAALTYDCQVYDKNNLCVSAGGRYTYAGPSASANQQAGLVVVGYRPVPTFRLGAFADQSVNISAPSGFTQSKNSPMWGLFANWNMNQDGNGLAVQASAVTSSSKLSVTRTQLTNTEAGSGNTQFDGQGYQLTTHYTQPISDATKLVPYLGLRYTRINAGAYTENATADVTAPLTYNAMAQNTFSAIGGVGVRSLLAEKLTGSASVGIQQNLNYSMGNCQGTSSVSGLESFSVQMPGNVNSMATATAGLYYDVNKRERLGFNVLWQQQPFIATNTTTALATYTIGF